VIQTESALSTQYHLQIFNIEGKVFSARNIVALDQLNYQISLPELPAGYYFIRINDKGNTYTRKILVE
jgi:hypothetical protein